MLTVLGLAFLVLIYISVQSLVATLETELTGSVSALGGEIDVWSKGASHPLLSRIPESYAETIKGISEVREAVPAVLALARRPNVAAKVTSLPCFSTEP